MTRFARAKGSKASNERVALDSTPWHIFKQQLEISLDKEKNAQVKTKSAKQLLKEKEEPYYATSLGNLNNDWAEFDKPKTKPVKNDKVQKIRKDNKGEKPKKKALDNAEQGSVTDSNICDKISKENLQQNENVTHADSQKVSKGKRKRVAKTPVEDQNEIADGEVKEAKAEQTKAPVPKQFKDKKRKKENSVPENKEKNIESENVSGDKTDESAARKNKLSKRQKRNQKRKMQQTEDKTEKINSSTFNTTGNDWDNSVSYDKRRKLNEKQGDQSFGGINQNIERRNFRKFGDNVPRKYQIKTAKIRDDNDHKRRKPEDAFIKVIINGVEVEIVKYDGFPVKKEDAERLIKLRKEMVLKGIPKADIDAAMKLERRKCEKSLARLRRHVCFHCRKAGHNLSDCPELEKEELGTGICFKCGSTEHTHFECKVNKSDDYRYAKCFICREQGHIAKQCPDNPKGLYPDGGACKICGDVTHLKKDCPDLAREKEDTTLTLDTIRGEDLELLGDEKRPTTDVKSSKKIVKF